MVQGKTVILDGAHNADAAQVLAESIRTFIWTRPAEDVKARQRVILVTGMVTGHNPVPFYQALAEVVDQAFVVPIDFHRAAPPLLLVEQLREAIPSAVAVTSVREGLERALAAAGGDDFVLVGGSFYLLGEAARALDGMK